MITEAGMTETDAAALMSVHKTQQSLPVNEGRVPIKGFSLFTFFYFAYVKKTHAQKM